MATTTKQMADKLDFNPLTGESLGKEEETIPTEKEGNHSKDYLNKIEVEISKGAKFDPDTGKEISVKFVQTFTKAEWARFEKDAPSLGYKYKVLYKPSKW